MGRCLYLASSSSKGAAASLSGIRFKAFEVHVDCQALRNTNTNFDFTPQTYTTERRMRDGEDIVALPSALLSDKPLSDLAQMARMPL